MLEIKSFDNNILMPEIGKLIQEGHTVTIQAKGRSMRPFMEDGRDKVVLAKMLTARVGDVILAHTIEKNFVVHRIISINGATGECVLQGDGNLDTEHCSLCDIMAIVSEIIVGKKGYRVSTHSRMWRIYSFIWVKLRPIRRYLLFIYRKVFLKHLR